MFAQKLSNPFLKQSPFFPSTSSASSSYNPPPLPPSRRNNFGSYDEPKFSSYSNIPATATYNVDPTYNSKSHEQVDLGNILSNNPFSRPTTGIFSYSRANQDISPNKYSGLNSSSQRPSSYTNNANYSGYNNGVDIPTRQVNYSKDYSKASPQRKYDNYLSTSSAESAVTYINKIYELDDDRSMDGTGNAVISNPFFRKNLLQERSYDKQVQPISSYDSASLKYNYPSTSGNERPSNYLKNNYMQTNQQNYDYQFKDVTPVSYNAVPHTSEYDKKNEDYEYKKKANPYQKKWDFKKYEIPVQKIALNMNNKYETKYSKNDDNKYESQNYQEKKYQPYEDNKLSLGNKYLQNNYGKAEEYKYEPKIQHYDEYKQYNEQNYTDKYKYQKELDEKYERSKQYNFEADNYEKYSPKIKHQSKKLIAESHSYQNYKPSIKSQYQVDSQKDLNRQNKKYQQKISFDDDSKYQSKYESKSSKYKQYQSYQGAFQTLGGVKNYKTSAMHGSKDLGNKENNKFVSSQVQQYEHPRQIQEKFKNNKNRDNQYEKQKPKSQNKIVTFQQNEEDDESEPRIKGAPTRDQQQGYPKILEINGLLFHRVQIN